MNDIDLSSYSNWDPIGDIDSGVGFTGTLDGNGYTISNLTINRPDENGVGLFGMLGYYDSRNVVVENAEVRNLHIQNANIVGGSSVGALAGNAACDIMQCSVSGNIDSSVTSNCTGGLVGILCSGNVEQCYSDGLVSGGSIVGGLIGFVYPQVQQTIIDNSYSLCNVNGSDAVGILVGMTSGCEISNVFASGKLICSNNVGGIIGISGYTVIKDSIWNTETTGQSVAVGDNQGSTNESNNKGLTSAEMQDPTNWQGWDDTVWDFSTYPPKLKWQTQSSTNPGGDTDADDPNTPGGGNVPIPGAVRLQIGSDSCSTSAIYVDTSFDLGAFDVDFLSADSCAAAIEDIDEVLSRINTKRSEFGAVINRLSSILESQTTTIQNFTSAKSTIMDADIANESADFVKNQILQQTSSALLAQSQNLHASIVLSLIG